MQTKYHIRTKYEWNGLGSISGGKIFSTESIEDCLFNFAEIVKEYKEEKKQDMYISANSETHFRLSKLQSSNIFLEHLSVWITYGNKNLKL